MASIVRRTAILGFARMANRALALLSPIFMVRLLSIEQYGEYRDFLLYGTLLYSVVEFSINSSLAYFVPKEPTRERLYFTQASFFVLCTSLAMILLVLILGDYAPSATIRSYQYALCLYIFLMSNLDAWEVFWIAKKQTINVLYYSLCRLGARTTVVIVAAYLTREVSWVIWCLVVFEALRLFVMGGYAAKQKLLIAQLNSAAMKAQFAYFGPLGVSNLIYLLNMYLGQLVVSAVLGPAALAVYTIGTYLYPIIHIFRGSIGDVIMPEIVSRQDVPTKVALQLWQRATLVYCAVMLPLAVLFYYYASVVVETLFTSAYAGATPIFQIFVFLLVRECFDFGVPLRVVNRTKIYLAAGIFSLIINIALVLVLFERFGLLAPPLAMIITRFVIGIYLGAYVMRYCEYTLAELLPWSDVAKTSLLCLACVPILYLGGFVAIGSLSRAIVFGAVYMAVYVGLSLKFGSPDIHDFLSRILAKKQSKAT